MEKYNLTEVQSYENPKIWESWINAQSKLEGDWRNFIWHTEYNPTHLMPITPQEKDLYRLAKSLPHGSGINGEWYLTYIKKGKKFYASNHYEAMNEQGSYCHFYEFTLTLSKTQRIDQNGNSYSEFEIAHFNFHDQRERACCGYGIKDYLWQTIQEALDHADVNEKEEA